MEKVRILVNGQQIEAGRDATILGAARENGICIPALCSHPDLPSVQLEPESVVYQGERAIYNQVGQPLPEPCGLCIVRVDGIKEPVRACETKVREGMSVITEDEGLKERRRERLKQILLTTNHPAICISCDRKPRCEPFGVCVRSANVAKRCVACPGYPKCELLDIADLIGMVGITLSYCNDNGQGSNEVLDNVLFEFDPALCVGCLRCVRMCNHVRQVGALGYVVHESRVFIGTKNKDFRDSGCRYCMGCVEVCPTGALTDKTEKWKPALRQEERAKELVPCRSACPADVDIPLYIYLVSQRKYEEAYKVIRQKLPFPLLCGMVCTSPCEEVCRRKDLDDAVMIRELKRFVAERCKEDSQERVLKHPTDKRVAIIGSGPAGLTAAYLLSKFGGHSVSIFEALPEPGGMPLVGIPRFRLPKKVLELEVSRLVKLGVDIETNTEVESCEDLLNNGFDVVLVATGAHRDKPLGIEGEIDNPAVMGAMRLLRNVNLGMPLELKDKSVIVVGGGNAAIDAARTCLRLGASDVRVIYRRSRNEMPAGNSELMAALGEGVEIVYQVMPLKFIGKDNGVALECVKTQLRGRDRSGRARPFAVKRSEFLIEGNIVITAVGQQAVVPKDLRGLITRTGLLSVDPENLMTPIKGVFAAGDVVSGPSSIIMAIGLGKKAARAIDIYLGGDGALEEDMPLSGIPAAVEKSEAFYKSRVVSSAISTPKSDGGSEVYERGLSEEMALNEAARCLRCSLRLQISGLRP